MSEFYLSGAPCTCTVVISYCKLIDMNNINSNNFKYTSKTNGGHGFDY